MTRSYLVNVAGRTLEVVGDGAVERFRPAFSRIEVAASGPADAMLDVETVADACHAAKPLVVGLNRGVDGSLAVLYLVPPMIEMFRPPGASGTGRPRLQVVASPAALLAGDVLAQPGHAAIAAWLATQDRCLMHAAGVAVDGRGIMLIGEGGRGKTTTALAAVQRGFNYLGDDLCILRPDSSGRESHQLHGLYATAKLNPDTRERLGLTAWHTLGTTPKGKTVAAIPAEVGFAATVPLTAIVAVGPSRDAGPRVTRLACRDALRQLGTASSPMLKAAGPSGGWLAAIARIARDVPVLSLALDWNLDRVVDSLAAIASAAARGAYSDDHDPVTIPDTSTAGAADGRPAP